MTATHTTHRHGHPHPTGPVYIDDGIDEQARLLIANIDTIMDTLTAAARGGRITLPLNVEGTDNLVTAAPLYRTAEHYTARDGHHPNPDNPLRKDARLLGVDLLYVPPLAAFPPHVHPGHHLLYVVRGTGTFTYDGEVIPTKPGDLYLALGGVPHAVGAGPDGHWLLSFGAPHKHVASPDRMQLTVDTAPDSPLLEQ